MSLPYRLGSRSMFSRQNEAVLEPKRVVFLSLEGTKTEVNYFQCVEKYKEEIGIDAIVHIEVLRKYDTNSDPENVLELLEEYIDFRNNNMFEKELSNLELKKYNITFIKKYLENPKSISKREKNKFEAILKEEHIDLLYLDFLSKFHGENDVFGIVIDRDCGSHPKDIMMKVVKKCRDKNYVCFITNPCFEFWQLLHVSDVITEYKDCLDKILKNELDEQKNTFISDLLYKKTNQRKAIQVKIFEKYYLPNIDLAIERSKDFAPENELLEKIGSNLGQLFEILRMP